MTGDLIVRWSIIVGAAALLWDKVVGPFLARPLVRALRKVIAYELAAMVDERITSHEAAMLRTTGELETRVRRLERRAGIESAGS